MHFNIFFFLQMIVSKRKSKYADYFDIKGSEAACLTCGAVLKISRGSTKGLKYHAEKKHNIDFGNGKQLQCNDISEITYEAKSSNDDFENTIEEVIDNDPLVDLQSFPSSAMSMKKKSKFADYFDIKGSEAICLTCEAVLKISGRSTTGLKYHAEKKHNIKFNVSKNHTVDFNEYESHYGIADENPWNINSLYAFLVFDCPSCNFKNSSKQEFVNHVCEMHSEAIDSLKNIYDGSTSDIVWPWEETDFKFEATEGHVDENYDISLEMGNNEPKTEIKSEINIEEDYDDKISKSEENMIISASKVDSNDNFQEKSNLVKLFSKSVVAIDENSPKKKSKYSEHFDIRGNIAVCLTCEAVVQCNHRTTSGMKYHAEKKHNIKLEDKATKANKLLEIFSNSPSNGDRKSKYHKYYDMRGDVAKCRKCDTILRCTDGSTKGLKFHAEKRHGIILDSTLLDSEGKIYVRPKPVFKKRYIKNSDKGPGICDLCGKEYENIHKLKEHRRYCLKSKKKEFKKCEFCSKTYNSLSLRTHIRAVHKKVKENICETCGKPFFSKTGLTMHMAVHFGNQLACDQCGKCYRDKTRLRQHIQIIHEGRRDYPCAHCQKAFPTRKYQKMHEEIVHLGIKRHKCHLCSNAYGQSHELKSHYRRAHNMDPNIVKKSHKVLQSSADY